MRYIGNLFYISVIVLLFTPPVGAQSAGSLKSVKRLFIGSLGAYPGGEELRRSLFRSLEKNSVFQLASTSAQSDAVLEGTGELWIRGYEALSPRARKNAGYSQPLYGGYLSVRLRGKDGEILWSYFADPRRITVHNLQRDLVDEVVTRLVREHNEEATPLAVTQSSNDLATAVRGAGATFPYPLYRDWFTSFHARHPAWTFTYSPTGSARGIDDLLAEK